MRPYGGFAGGTVLGRTCVSVFLGRLPRIRLSVNVS